MIMKTKILVIALAIVCSSLGFASAQKEKKIYGFAYAYRYNQKVLYMSPLLNGVEKSTMYFDAMENALYVQWDKKLKTLLDDSYNYTKCTYAWFYDYDKTNDYRTEIIGNYKQKGFSIHYVDDFYFKKEKR